MGPPINPEKTMGPWTHGYHGTMGPHFTLPITHISNFEIQDIGFLTTNRISWKVGHRAPSTLNLPKQFRTTNERTNTWTAQNEPMHSTSLDRECAFGAINKLILIFVSVLTQSIRHTGDPIAVLHAIELREREEFRPLFIRVWKRKKVIAPEGGYCAGGL